MVNLFHLDPQPAQQLKALMRQDGRTAVWMYAPGYIREDSLSLQFVEDLTGLSLAKSDRGDGHTVLENEGGAFDAGHPHLSPTIAVADPVATTLAGMRTETNQRSLPKRWRTACRFSAARCSFPRA